MNAVDDELKRITDEVSNLMEEMFYTYVNSGPFVSDPDELLREWSPPDDDRIVDVLAELFRNPTDYVRENGATEYWEERVVNEVFMKAVGSDPARTAKCRQMVADPSVRPLITMTFSTIQGEERSRMRDLLMDQVQDMSEYEIDSLIEDLLSEDYYSGTTNGYKRMIALLEQAPAHYKPHLFYLQGGYATVKEWGAGRAHDWESLVDRSR